MANIVPKNGELILLQINSICYVPFVTGGQSKVGRKGRRNFRLTIG